MSIINKLVIIIGYKIEFIQKGSIEYPEHV